LETLSGMPGGCSRTGGARPDEKRLRTYWIDPQRNLVLKAVQFDKLSGEAANAWRRRLRRRSERPRAIRPFRTAPLPSSHLRTQRR
jgi:hypothetical protein